MQAFLFTQYNGERLLFGHVTVADKRQLRKLLEGLRESFDSCELCNVRGLPIETVDPQTLPEAEERQLRREWSAQERFIGIIARRPDKLLSDPTPGRGETLAVLLFAANLLQQELRVLADADSAYRTSQAGPATVAEAEISLEEKALAVLTKHPDWSPMRIAKAVGCSRQSLYRWPRFAQARFVLESGKDSMPCGRKNAETGTVEAWDE